MRQGCGTKFERSNLEAPIRPYSSGSLVSIACCWSQVLERERDVEAESGGRERELWEGRREEKRGRRHRNYKEAFPVLSDVGCSEAKLGRRMKRMIQKPLPEQAGSGLSMLTRPGLCRALPGPGRKQVIGNSMFCDLLSVLFRQRRTDLVGGLPTKERRCRTKGDGEPGPQKSYVRH